MSKFFVLGTKLAQANDNVAMATGLVVHSTKSALSAFIAGYKAQHAANKSGKAVAYPYVV